MYIFNTLNDALIWSTEILRARTNPQTLDVYQRLKDLNDGMGFIDQRFDPTSENALHHALDIQNIIEKTLSADHYKLLKFKYWGDYATPARLHQARQLQEKCRREGRRVRLSWRYSNRQLATLWQVSSPTIAKRLDAIYTQLHPILQAKEIVKKQP